MPVAGKDAAGAERGLEVSPNRGHLQLCAAAQRLVAAPVCRPNYRLDGDRESSLSGRSSRSLCDALGDDCQVNSLRAHHPP